MRHCLLSHPAAGSKQPIRATSSRTLAPNVRSLRNSVFGCNRQVARPNIAVLPTTGEPRMLQYPRRSIRAALLSTAVTIAGSWAAHAAVPANTLYILDNNGAPGQNAVLGFHRNIDGSLTKLPGSPFLT